VPHSVARARHILADSRSTKDDLISLLGAPADKVTVVGAGVEARFRPVEDAVALAEIRRKYRLPDQFVLGLGTLEPRKNFEGLIHAFNRLQADWPDLHLVIAGGKGWLYDSILAAAAQSPAAHRIHLPGFIADADLPGLYTLARVFAYPSHYEGFGIPVLEAMACGTPVVTADNSSLPEVAGQAALLVPATDVEALAEAITRLTSDEALRDQCRRLGFAQARPYTWEAAARKLLAVYETLTGTEKK
jgi:glycosyltransferase involved in cell wall biosynthesis